MRYANKDGNISSCSCQTRPSNLVAKEINGGESPNARIVLTTAVMASL